MLQHCVRRGLACGSTTPTCRTRRTHERFSHVLPVRSCAPLWLFWPLVSHREKVSVASAHVGLRYTNCLRFDELPRPQRVHYSACDYLASPVRLLSPPCKRPHYPLHVRQQQQQDDRGRGRPPSSGPSSCGSSSATPNSIDSSSGTPTANAASQFESNGSYGRHPRTRGRGGGDVAARQGSSRGGAAKGPSLTDRPARWSAKVSCTGRRSQTELFFVFIPVSSHFSNGNVQMWGGFASLSSAPFGDNAGSMPTSACSWFQSPHLHVAISVVVSTVCTVYFSPPRTTVRYANLVFFGLYPWLADFFVTLLCVTLCVVAP